MRRLKPFRVAVVARNVVILLIVVTVILNGYALRTTVRTQKDLKATQDRQRISEDQIKEIAETIAREVVRKETPTQRRTRIGGRASEAIGICLKQPQCRRLGRRAFSDPRLDTICRRVPLLCK